MYYATGIRFLHHSGNTGTTAGVTRFLPSVTRLARYCPAWSALGCGACAPQDVKRVCRRVGGGGAAAPGRLAVQDRAPWHCTVSECGHYCHKKATAGVPDIAFNKHARVRLLRFVQCIILDSRSGSRIFAWASFFSK